MANFLEAQKSVCPQNEELLVPIYKISFFTTSAAILPWIGVVLDQLYHRNFTDALFGNVIMVLGAVAIIIVLAQMIKLLTQKSSPVRKILPILLVLELGSIISFIAGLLAYLFL